MAEIEVEATTVEEAIQDGLTRLGIPRETVDIKILNEGTAGLFGLMGTKPARVRLTTKSGAGNSLGDNDLDYPRAQKAAGAIATDLLTRMGVPFDGVDVRLVTGRIVVDVRTGDTALFIGKNAQTLDALELIVNLILSREAATRVRVTVDCGQYRLRQEDQLHHQAAEAAAQVKATGTPYRFDPMPPIARRIIHLALKDDPEIETSSEGDGALRRVVITMKPGA